MRETELVRSVDHAEAASELRLGSETSLRELAEAAPAPQPAPEPVAEKKPAKPAPPPAAASAAPPPPPTRRPPGPRPLAGPVRH